MVTQRKPKASKYLTAPIRPVQVDRDRSVAGLLEKMEGAGLGARQLAEAHRIWLDMLGDNTTIIVAASGALIPAGMRRLLAYVIKNRFVDVLVLSGSLLFHDLHESLGRQHFQSHPSMTDAELESAQIGRMWDVLASEEEYGEAGEWVGGFANQLDQARPYSTREFLHLLGRELAEIATEDGVLTSAYKSRVPIFCPTIADSAVTLGIAAARFEKKNSFCFDLVQDVLDMTQVAARARVTGVINIGGGTSRSFIQQMEVATNIVKTPARGHKYAIQIATDAPHPGGRSTSSTVNDDSLIFGKLSRGATSAYVNCDATIALPILVTALSQTAAKYMKGRKRPSFTFSGRDLSIEVP
ncbi:MAG TPA: deoxyhypusine synthase family protein [Pyrinomonadaceae bacterium]|nr:deoxyhypusine synthase family protein [Pyrinomonadaceae bacterium]